MKQLISNKATTSILVALGTLLFGYTLLRDCLLSITWDEAYSYSEYVRKGVFIQEKMDGMSANNHLLNNWLDIFFVKLFGVNQFVLRIPSLIAHALFLVYSAKLVRHFHSNVLVVVSFLIINLNPYLLDFFSLARGYGLSIGFMMVSIYYLYVFQKEQKNRFAAFSIIFASLAVLSHFVLLNYCLTAIGCVFLISVLKALKEKGVKQRLVSFCKSIFLPSIIFLKLLDFTMPLVFQLKGVGALYFGGENGFWEDTFTTIIERSFYGLNYNDCCQDIAKWFIASVSGVAVIWGGIQIIRKKYTIHNSFLIIMLLITIGCVASTIVQHEVLETLYLKERTALFFIVLFTVTFVFFVNELSMEKRLLNGIAYLWVFAATIHTARAMNMKYVLEFKSNADTREMLDDLEKMKKIPFGKRNISINISLDFESAVNFYRETDTLNWINPVVRDEERNKLNDYFFLTQEALSWMKTDSIEILKTYPLTKNVIARSKYLKAPKMCISKELNFNDEPDHCYYMDSTMEYSKTIEYVLNDSITPGKNVVVVFDAVVMATKENRYDMKMVVSVDCKNTVDYWRCTTLLDYPTIKKG